MSWKDAQINRREWLGGLAALATPTGVDAGEPKEAAGECRLANANLDFRLTVSGGKLASRSLGNKLANERVELPATDFALEFEGGSVVNAPDMRVQVARKDASRIELLYAGGGGAAGDLEVLVAYSLVPGKHYLRKQLGVRQPGEGRRLRLMRADLDPWQGVRREWKSAQADRLRYGSHPIFCETMWAGVEFVAAFNEYNGDGFVLRSRPGGKVLTADWLKLHSTVAGVTAPGGARDSFLRYIDDVRLAPPRLVADYNSWWSLPEIFNQGLYLELVRTLVKSLYEKHGVFFDYVTADMGWSDRHSIWGVNRKDFLQGLSPVVEAIRGAGGKLGLWMSPSETYPPVIDYAWARQNGYTVLDDKAISLGDPKYRQAAKEQLARLVKENQLGHMKFDGFIARETAAHDDLLPGDDSVEPLAEASLELMTAAKEADPALFTEPTYLNSWANYISPWIIKHADSVWGNSGGDCPLGMGPAPDYREAHTTAREYFIFTSLQEIWLPQNALQYFDIVHCDAGGSFPNHAAMAFGRGRFFVSTYINPKFMTDEDWGIYGGLLKWARSRTEILRHTVVLTSKVELGEPYAYAHWSGTRGIIAVRNPSNESKRFNLEMARTGAPQELSAGVCYTQYPYRKGIADEVTSASNLALDLAPWEMLFLEIVPRAELEEPVALGARWYRGAQGSMEITAEGSGRVRILLPHAGEQEASATPADGGELRGELLGQSIQKLAETQWLRRGDQPLPSASFELTAEISLPREASKGQALLLLEFPGKDHLPSRCSCQVNGKDVELRESSSAGHIGYNMVVPGDPWHALLPYMSNWTWYVAELEGGTAATVKFSGVCPAAGCKMGLWAWADWDLGQQTTPVPAACPEPAMPQYLERWKRRGICLLPPALPRPADLSRQGLPAGPAAG